MGEGGGMGGRQTLIDVSLKHGKKKAGDIVKNRKREDW